MQNFVISVFTEDRIGLLQRVTLIFTRRHVNIKSITAGECEVKGIYRYSIVVEVEEDMVKKLVAQLEKQVEILKAFYHTPAQVLSREVALYKLSVSALKEYDLLTRIMNEHHARVLGMSEDYLVVEKTGDEKEINDLFAELSRFDILEFTRSGTVAITKPMKTLSAFLQETLMVN